MTIYFETQSAKIAHSAWKRLDLTPPCNLYAIAEFLGVEVSRETLANDAHGVFIRLPDGRKIVKLCDGLPYEASRMVLAHELSHCIYTKSVSYAHKTVGACSDAEERLCDELAINLLMPELHLRREAARLNHPAVNKVGTLKVLFGVSYDIMRRRLRELHLI